MRENVYQAKLIKKLKHLFKGCIVLKNDPSYLQGVPDLLVLYKNKWAMLEVKPSSYFTPQPNQNYYIKTLNKMSFAAYIFPEIEEEVLLDLQYAFQPRRAPRVSKR